jgi:hypothetical protein
MPSAFLDEAAYLAAAVPQNRCPSTDALDVLDTHPHIRLALEDTWTGPGGRVYREVPAETVSRWPGHIARTFKSFLRIGRDPAQVFELLDLLHELDAGTEVVKMSLVGCRRRGELTSALSYYRMLVNELREVTYEPNPRIEVQTCAEPRSRPRFDSGEVTEGTWSVEDDQDAEPRTSPCHRAVLLHDPISSTDDDRDWIQRQPRQFRQLYFRIKRAKISDLSRMKSALRDIPAGDFGPSQLTVLWDTYRIRRDYLRRRREHAASQRLGATASKLVRRIRRVRTRPELGYIGKRLYESMKGEIQLPGPVSNPEWGVIFEAFNQRKAALLTPTPSS